MITEIRGICMWHECSRNATQIAAGKGEDAEPEVYCDEHAEKISSQGLPVVVVDCPNCHCAFGVWL